MAATRLNTPAITNMYKNADKEMIEEMLRHGEKTLADNWENHEHTYCEKCHGTGEAQPGSGDDHCVACEGTGIWFTLYYGIEDGVPYAYTDEYGIDYMKEVCKEFRSAHRQMQLAGKTMTHMRPYLLPKTLEMELLARGYNPRSDDDEEKIAIMNLVAQEYPDFLCVNYKRF